jgi:hypothetical protein
VEWLLSGICGFIALIQNKASFQCRLPVERCKIKLILMPSVSVSTYVTRSVPQVDSFSAKAIRRLPAFLTFFLPGPLFAGG